PLTVTSLAGTQLYPTANEHCAQACTLNATGSDKNSMTTSLVNIGGTITVVMQGDNPVESPELVIGRGHFSGKMDFSPAIPPNNVPLGSVVGEVGLNGSRPVPFTGVFRLPVGTASMSFYLGASGSWVPVLANVQGVGCPAATLDG